MQDDIVQETYGIFLFPNNARVRTSPYAFITPTDCPSEGRGKAEAKDNASYVKGVLVLTHLPLSLYIYCSAPYRHQTPLQSYYTKYGPELLNNKVPTDVQNMNC
jgi:hypothetical protein